MRRPTFPERPDLGETIELSPKEGIDVRRGKNGETDVVWVKVWVCVKEGQWTRHVVPLSPGDARELAAVLEAAANQP